MEKKNRQVNFGGRGGANGVEVYIGISGIRKGSIYGKIA